MTRNTNNSHNNNDNWQHRYADIISKGTAASTRRAYQRDLAYFWALAKQALR